MKSLLLLLLTGALTISAAQAQVQTTAAAPAPQKDVRVVQAACGQCQLDLPGKSCDLAVRFDGKAYFVDGTTIDSHGDAHAKDGFCQAIRRAEVQGEVVDNRFKATYFRLLPEPATGK